MATALEDFSFATVFRAMVVDHSMWSLQLTQSLFVHSVLATDCKDRSVAMSHLHVAAVRAAAGDTGPGEELQQGGAQAPGWLPGQEGPFPL